MYIQLLTFLLFAGQIISNGSSLLNRDSNSIRRETRISTGEIDLPEGYVSFFEDHAAYKIHKEGKTWYEARDECIAEGARLAITDTSEKIAHINSLKHNWGIEWLHVGIYRSNTTDQWVRIDNNFPLISIPWGNNSPKGGNRYCAGISFMVDILVDYPCHWNNEYFVCEIPI